MSYLSAMNAGIQAIEGGIAASWGETYDVYRLTASSSGQIVSGTPAIAGFTASLEHWKNLRDIENQVFDALSFAATCNNTLLQIGDVLYGTGTDRTMYVVGDMRPLHHTIVIRCEQSATITRPTTLAATTPLNVGRPTQIKSYNGVTKTTEQVLVLNNGAYAFAASGSSAMVPFGLQPLNRLREMPPSKLPTDTKRETFVGFLPLLEGVILEENDVISSGSAGDRYRIEQNYIAEFGLQGQVLLLEKVTV